MELPSGPPPPLLLSPTGPQKSFGSLQESRKKGLGLLGFKSFGSLGGSGVEVQVLIVAGSCVLILGLGNPNPQGSTHFGIQGFGFWF